MLPVICFWAFQNQCFPLGYSHAAFSRLRRKQDLLYTTIVSIASSHLLSTRIPLFDSTSKATTLEQSLCITRKMLYLVVSLDIATHWKLRALNGNGSLHNIGEGFLVTKYVGEMCICSIMSENLMTHGVKLPSWGTWVIFLNISLQERENAKQILFSICLQIAASLCANPKCGTLGTSMGRCDKCSSSW